MKRLEHYFPNFILTVILVLSIAGFSSVMFASGRLYTSSAYISSFEKHGVYQKVYDYAEGYFSDNYNVSGIPPEIYMDAVNTKTIKQAVDLKVNAFTDYITGKTDKLEYKDPDLTELRNNLSAFFEEFAKENNVELNDEFTAQLDNTIESAENDIGTFSNVFMLDFMEKAGLLRLMRKLYPLMPAITAVLGAAALVCVLLIAVINRKNIRYSLYWLAVSGLCASAIMLIPCLYIKISDYFSRLVMRTDYIYYAVTGFLNDTIDSFTSLQLNIFGFSALILAAFCIWNFIYGRKHKE